MRICLVSDAWLPQTNGVVTTLSTVVNHLEILKHQVHVISPNQFKTIPCPTYPEIRLVVNPFKIVSSLESLSPSAVHIATEGPLGLVARHYCVKRKIPFTTSFHTRFPEYIHARTFIPPAWTYRLVRWFHAPAVRVMVAADSIRKELKGRGFQNLTGWSRGVDAELFRPRTKKFLKFPRPIFLYVGRVAVEKNIRAFLDLKLKGTKLIVGDGPQLENLKREYPKCVFVGVKYGDELAQYYAASDAFIFPSRTDTFGLVMLEALASGIPVAAYPVPGPLDVINGSGVGILNENLYQAALQCLLINPKKCRNYALQFTWRSCAELFFKNLEPIH